MGSFSSKTKNKKGKELVEKPTSSQPKPVSKSEIE